MELKNLLLGTSSCFTGKLDEESFGAYAASGIDCLEYSGKYLFYFENTDFHKNAAAYGKLAKKCGVTPWSLHLPFSRRLDISSTDKEQRAIIIYFNKYLINCAAEAGAKVIVLHPSSEPIDDEARPERMKLSRDAIAALSDECEKCGVKLAVENLPRTCLCRTSDEMIDLIGGFDPEKVGVVFDTNHSLTEDNVHYVKALTSAGVKIHTLHISDYYRDDAGVLDERHVLAGEGINRWGELLDAILANGYDGPLMYEVPSKVKNREIPLTVAELSDNMHRLRAGLIR